MVATVREVRLPTGSRHGHCLTMLAVLAVSASTVLASQLTRDAQTGLNAPFFVMIVHTSMMVVCWLPAKLLSRGKPVCAGWRDVLLLLPFWLASNYCFVAALARAPAGLVQTLFGTAPAIVAMLSVAILKEPCSRARACAVALALLGTIGVGCRDWRPAHDEGEASLLLGIALALGAVVAAASYKVAFKARYSEPPIEQVLGCLATLGLCAGVFGFPVAVLLGALGAEDAWWRRSGDVRWTLVLASAALDVLYNTSVAWGLALANPTFVAVGVILGIPANLLIDALYRHIYPRIGELAGALLIVVSFTVLAWWRAPPQEHNNSEDGEPLAS